MCFISKLGESPYNTIFELALYIDVDSVLMPLISFEPRIAFGRHEKILYVFERWFNKLNLKIIAH